MRVERQIPPTGWPYPWTSRDAAIAREEGWCLTERSDGYYEIQMDYAMNKFSSDLSVFLYIHNRIDSEFYAKAWHLHGTKVPPKTLDKIVHLHAYSEDEGVTQATRDAKISCRHNALVIDLSHPDGDPDDPASPRVWIEWRESCGWVVILHSYGSNDPSGRVFLGDDGKTLFEKD